ncbi:MAG: potassium-transporting ATPase subunit C [Gemmataceae bacterium]|nr:potassium-transporting ATPase subunit C [Gemmataceae bacterium]
MNDHLRADLWLLGITLLVCSVLYPLALLGVGQGIFPNQAQGSLLDEKGNPTTDPARARGSRLIAQGFSGDEYFQPRPSAASYNGAASGASNWGASNPLLRDRVARQLGPLVEYREGSPERRAKEEKGESPRVAPAVVAWFRSRPDVVKEWVKRYPSSAQAWVNADDKHKAAVAEWAKAHPEAVAEWKKGNPGAEPKPADLAAPFFEGNAAAFHKSWPKLTDDAGWSVPAVFFDMWRQENPRVDLEPVPADLVMASGSGLDPHITLANARYQLKHRVAAAQAAKLLKAQVEEVIKAREADGKKVDEAERKKIEEKATSEAQARVGKPLEEKIHETLERRLHNRMEAPLGGLVGVDLVNVLEVNLAMNAEMERLAKAIRADGK